MEQLLTVQEVAELLQVDDSNVRRMVRRGDLKAVRIGGLWRIRPAVVRQLAGEEAPGEVAGSVNE